MKTLQEQYNLIKKGKGHKSVFLKEAKRLFPNIVPNAAGFDQAAKLLKQRSAISEHNDPSFKKHLSEATKATEKKTSKEVQDLNKVGYDYKDPKNLNNQIFDQYIKGLRFELEKDLVLLDDEPAEAMEKAKAAVAKNLASDPLYYMKNAAFGIEGLGYKTLKEPKEPTGKHKSSGYGDLKENKMNKSTQLKELLEEAVAGIPSIGNPFADRKKPTYEDKFAAFLAEEKKEAKEAKEKADEAKKETDEGKEMVDEMEPKMKEEKEPKKEGKMKFEEVVKMAEKAGKMAENRVYMEIYGSKKKELEETLSSINEDNNLQEFIDEGKIQAVQKEIALYEKYFMNAEANYNNLK